MITSRAEKAPAPWSLPLIHARSSLRPPQPSGRRHPEPAERRNWTVTKIEIELPEATAEAARNAGLLTSEALGRLLTDAIRRRQAADSLLSIAERIQAAGIPPMSMDEIDAEVKAYRAERRHRAGSR